MRLLTLILLVLLSAGITPVQAERRLALVIGVNEYQNVAKLDRAVGDARALETAFRRVGFEVRAVYNPDRSTLNEQFGAFVASIQPGDTVLVHYSGHGIEIDGANFLLPTNTPSPETATAQQLKLDAVSVEAITDGLKAAQPKTAIFILDACRNNPYSIRGSRSVGGQRGIATLPISEVFMMYSASRGQAALDRLNERDREDTSVFTRVFLKQFEVPGRSISDVAQIVRREVTKLAPDQRPAYYDELLDPFYFVPGRSVAVEPRPKPENPSPTRDLVSSTTGVKVTFAHDLLYTRPDARDIFTPEKEAYTTVWNSKTHGESVSLFLQVSSNPLCRSPEEYAAQVLAPSRQSLKRSSASREFGSDTVAYVSNWAGYRGDPGTETYDVIVQDAHDPTTIFHIGGRFPAGASAVYISEVVEVAKSLVIPNLLPFSGRCLRKDPDVTGTIVSQCRITYDPAGRGANVRNEPSVRGGLVTTLAMGDVVRKVGSVTDVTGHSWLRVTPPNRDAPAGWVSASLLACSR